MTAEHALYALALVQLLDVLSTLYAFRNGAVEANPVMRKLIETLGAVPGLVLPKLVYGGAVWYWRDQFSVWAVSVVCVVYVAVIANNLRIARKA
jgi:hypothetical protein